MRAIGASNYSADRLRQALEISQQQGFPRYESLQPLYNLYDRSDYEQNLEPLCQEQEIGVISYFSLASGFLSGKYRSEKDLSDSSRAGFVKKYLNERGFRLLEAIDAVAKNYNTTPTQISLAWLIARQSVTAPIVSATKIEQLNEIIKATNLKLEPASIQELDRAMA